VVVLGKNSVFGTSLRMGNSSVLPGKLNGPDLAQRSEI
jgi:hypothetical protein